MFYFLATRIRKKADLTRLNETVERKEVILKEKREEKEYEDKIRELK